MEPPEASELSREVIDLVGEAVIGDQAFFEEVLVAFLARGHVLIEDVPGTGKTLTARTFAQALGLAFSRIQFTPDLLPADITGTNVYDQDDASFEFNEGPLFANIVLADEINRAPPKSQAALLEAMEERQVTADGVTYELPEPFFVLATQNPVEQEGTFRLPEAQVDRFMVKTSMGYPDPDGELELLDRRGERAARTPSIESDLDHETVTQLRTAAESVTVSEPVKQYIIDIADETREHEYVDIGVSPRGIQRMYESARARAVLEGRDYAVPEDVKRLAKPVFAHRLVLTTEAKVRAVDKREVIEAVVDGIDVPEATGAPASSAP